MLSFLKGLVDYNARELKKYERLVVEINELDEKVRSLKDSDFPKETARLREEIAGDEDALLKQRTYAFALVREAARRSMGMRHYDEQLIAGLALSDGQIAEQKTGEGKTLSATLGLYYRGLMGRGAHLVTVNDYLARRDAGWMGKLFHFLGMNTAAMISNASFVYDPKHKETGEIDERLARLRPITRQEAYAMDITYGINSEFGFDYLRDHMVMRPADRVQRDHYFAIVDEADSVLIDEARTPHIISTANDQDVSRYYDYARIVKRLKAEDHYIVDEKARTANLTDEGISHIEKQLGVSNLYEQDFETLYHIEAALKAEALFTNNKEYIVRSGEVIIVDEFTGRLLEGRRFSEGIHQAIEAKEGVAIQQESKTLATISLQNYFRKYTFLGGMTGTASTEAEEFHKIYESDVMVVPTHRPIARKDEPDFIYKTQKAKYEAVVADVAEQYKAGRPVLIGTTSIEKNELVAQLLRKNAIPHKVLNAKNHVEEARIIAEAGRKHAVTVATNMAGRGVDIILGGDPTYEDEKAKKKHDWQKEHDEIIELGGLYVIGTERHESRRIDNQLRGRSGRQGDPGESRFYVSLEDDLMRIFGGEQIAKLMTAFNFPEDQPLTHAMVTRVIEQAQIKVEGFNFDQRKTLVEYDDVLNQQREVVYDLRNRLLDTPATDPEAFKATVYGMFGEIAQGYANQAQVDAEAPTDENIKALISEVQLIAPVTDKTMMERVKKHDEIGMAEYIQDTMEKAFSKKEKEYGQEVWYDIVRFMYVTTLDTLFTQHLTSIDDLREGIGLRRHAQLDPLVQYKNEAFTLFEQLLRTISFEGTRRMMNVQVEVNTDMTPKQQDGLVFDAPTAAPAIDVATGKLEEEKAAKKKKAKVSAPKKEKIGRNDPCWCGSGKKYKKCHMAEDEAKK